MPVDPRAGKQLFAWTILLKTAIALDGSVTATVVIAEIANTARDVVFFMQGRLRGALSPPQTQTSLADGSVGERGRTREQVGTGRYWQQNVTGFCGTTEPIAWPPLDAQVLCENWVLTDL